MRPLHLTCTKATLAAGLFLALAGCFGPDYEHVANDLRDRNLKLQQKLVATTLKLQNSEATVANLQSATPRLSTLPLERLATLYTADHVTVTDVLVNPNGFRVMFRPLSEEGFTVPATGDVTIEAFDHSIKDGSNLLGSWPFTAAQLKPQWYGSLGLNHFAVDCPWVRPPAGTEINFDLTFKDALTGRTMTTHKVITIPQKPSPKP